MGWDLIIEKNMSSNKYLAWKIILKGGVGYFLFNFDIYLVWRHGFLLLFLFSIIIVIINSSFFLIFIVIYFLYSGISCLA